ncbi:type II secretion system F family protein [Nocardioides speluncae]|uniref:type II secretion system F family protein n=1 Tax=Nocardioides speluncae TaxID=2670337 RepID=UPI000D69A1D7|nr:type II secretion system F family protein [Nocardioides speluncae]
MTLAAAGCAALAVWLSVPPRPAPVAVRSRPRVVVAAVVALALVTALLHGRVLVLALVVGTAALGASALLARRRRRREAERFGDHALEACELLAAELQAGQPPGVALGRVSEEFAAFGAVARAHQLGSDVPAAWRSLASTPGGGDLRLVAGAWQVAARSGSGLADAVSGVAASLRAVRATRRVVASELASARATARLMAALPVLALLMGSGIGGNPWAFLFGTPLGLGCLGLGLAFGLAGIWWIEAIADGITKDTA